MSAITTHSQNFSDFLSEEEPQITMQIYSRTLTTLWFMYRLYGMPEWTLFWTLFGRRSWNLARMDFSGNRVRMLPNISRKDLFLCSPWVLSISHILFLHLLSITTFISNQSLSFSHIQMDVHVYGSRIKKGKTDLIYTCCASRNVHSFLTNCASGVWCHQRVWSECLFVLFFSTHHIKRN